MCLSVITRHVLAASLVSEVICGALVLASLRLFGVPPAQHPGTAQKGFSASCHPVLSICGKAKVSSGCPGRWGRAQIPHALRDIPRGTMQALPP